LKWLNELETVLFPYFAPSVDRSAWVNSKLGRTNYQGATLRRPTVRALFFSTTYVHLCSYVSL